MSLITRIKSQKQKLALLLTSSLQVFVNFFTTVIILRHVGLGEHLDVFYIALGVFAFLYTSICWSITSVLTQYLIENRRKNKEGSLYITVALMTAPIAILMLLTMPFWTKLLYANYDGIVQQSDILFIQGTLIVAFLLDGLTLVYHAMLYEKNKYVTFNVVTLSASILGLILMLLTIDTYGVFVASTNQFLIKLVLFLSFSYMFLPKIFKYISFDKEQFLLIFNRSKYLLLGSVYYRTDEVVERFIASFFVGGFVSLISFIFRVYGAIITVLNSIIGFPSITVFAELIVENKIDEAKKTVIKYVLMLIAINLVIFIGLALFGEWFFTLIMGEGLSEELKPMLYISILCLYAFVLGKTVSQTLQSLLIAMKKGSISTLYDSIAYTINVCFKVGLSITYGMHGLLAAIVIGMFVTDGSKMYLVMREFSKLSHKKITN